MRLLITLLLLSIAGAAHAAEPMDLAPVKKWIAKQDEFNSVQADFTQTRALRALRSPVASPGRLTFAAPNSLRWELGDPPKTIVLRKGDNYTLIQPAKKKAERIDASNIGQEGGAKGFAMMEFPIAKDFADFQKKFEILAVSTEGDHCNLELLPRDPQARKFLNALKFNFNTKTNHMNSFEIVTKEGSSMKNEFSNVRVNQKIDRRTFEFDLTGYDVTDGKK